MSKEEIEEVFANDPMGESDPYPYEKRWRAVGKTQAGRYVFIVYTERYYSEKFKIRPISARYMHEKDSRAYEKDIKKTVSRFPQ